MRGSGTGCFGLNLLSLAGDSLLFSDPLTGQTASSVALHRLRIKLSHPAPPSHLLSLSFSPPACSQAHEAIDSWQKSRNPCLIWLTGHSPLRNKNVDWTLFCSEICFNWRPRVDWGRAGIVWGGSLVLHATRQAGAAFYCWIIYKTVWERVCSSWMEKESWSRYSVTISNHDFLPFSLHESLRFCLYLKLYPV